MLKPDVMECNVRVLREEWSSRAAYAIGVTMFKPFMRSGSLLAVLPACLLACGCSVIGGSGLGEAGAHDVVAGNWDGARAEFTSDYQYKPHHPITVFNMGASYHHFGDTDKADTFFREAVVIGKTYIPDGSLEPVSAGPTVRNMACARLHVDHRLDANCGDEIALEVPVPPPAPVAQAAPEPPPAIEAQATAEPAKQDRN